MPAWTGASRAGTRGCPEAPADPGLHLDFHESSGINRANWKLRSRGGKKSAEPCKGVLQEDAPGSRQVEGDPDLDAAPRRRPFQASRQKGGGNHGIHSLP